MSRALACSLLATLAACGDDGSSATIDSGRIDSPDIDAADTDCDYTEQSDPANDTSSTGGVTETTGLTFSSRTVICGTIDHTHFDGDITIDGDSFTLSLAAEADVVVRFVGPGAELLELVGVDVNVGGNFAGGIVFYGNHGVTSVHLPAGEFELLALSLGSQAIVSSVPYRIEVTIDTPDTRCPEVTSGGYMEADDTGTNTGNDVFSYPMGSPVTFTAANDAAETTNIVLAPDLNIRFHGEAANVTAADRYEDRDTYEIATGLGTNELTVRLTWPTAGANLDWFLYEKNTVSTPPSVGSGISSAALTEMKLTAIKPNTTYWLTVVAKVGTTVPATYNATLCAAQYTP